MQNLLAYSERLCAVPTLEGLGGIVDLVHPKTVTAKILHALKKSNQEGITWINESGDQEISFEMIPSFLRAKTGRTMLELPLSEWLARAKDIGLPEGMAAIFGNIGNGEVMNFPRIVRS